MKKICFECDHLERLRSSEFYCGRCDTYYNGEYGPFVHGAECIHDDRLGDGFEKGDENRKGVIKMSGLIKTIEGQNSALREENRILKKRLTST